jgi:hypothetical protein
LFGADFIFLVCGPAAAALFYIARDGVCHVFGDLKRRAGIDLLRHEISRGQGVD